MKKSLDIFNASEKQAFLLNNIGALLRRDMDAIMPEDAHEERASQISLITKYSYETVTEKGYESAVMGLMEKVDDLDPVLTRRVYLAHKELLINKKLSAEFVQRRSDAHSLAHKVWSQARKDNDFSSFAPHLQKNIDLDREYVDLTSDGSTSVYNNLLDIYEEGITSDQIDSYFDPIKSICKKIIGEHKKSDKIKNFTLHEPEVSLEKKKAVVDKLVDTIGFDRSAGTTGVVTHPFMITVGSKDVRINTRYTDATINAIYSMIHELGHGFCEHYTLPEFANTNLFGGVSLGIHESQSRYLENILGRSKEFSSWLCSFTESEGMTLGTQEEVHSFLNQVAPGLIRIDADEVTYNLHIIIRYEIEKRLFDGSLTVNEIPDLWNDSYKDYLGIEVQSDTEGCLQDVHWTSGFGYFPTYVLGNIYGAELHEKMMQDHPNLFDQIATGDFSNYIDRSREHIRQHGKRYTPQELITRTTGKESISSDAFVSYLEKKYLD